MKRIRSYAIGGFIAAVLAFAAVPGNTFTAEAAGMDGSDAAYSEQSLTSDAQASLPEDSNSVAPSDNPTIPVTGITIGRTDGTQIVNGMIVLDAAEDQNLELTASVEPEDATDKTVIWQADSTAYSGNADIHVDENGTVAITGYQAGSAMIQAASADGKINASVRVIATGWGQNAQKQWYYVDASGTRITGWRDINGSKYYFNADGVMASNQWIGDYYVYPSGAMATSTWIGNYYVDSTGAYVRNQWVDGGRYYVGSDGLWVPDRWVHDSSGWWYRYGDGSYPYYTWTLVNGTWYWFDGNGYMATGWRNIGGNWYYLTGSGAMLTGWGYINGAWYYTNSAGVMLTGWQRINGTYYYLNASGTMAYSEWRDGYWLSSNGAWTYPYQASWKLGTSGWWYGDASGWFAANGVQYINGVPYTFDAAGYWVDPTARGIQAYFSSTPYLILIDTAGCRVKIYHGYRGAWTQIYDWVCAPGKSSTPTVKGQFKVSGRKPGFGDKSYVVYNATRFYGSYYFHSILYYPGTRRVKDGTLGRQVSHGCVRLALENAQWIYNNIGDGTTVISY